MTSLEKQIVTFFEDNMGCFTNDQDVYMDMDAKYGFFATASLPGETEHIIEVSVSRDWTSLSGFITELNIKKLADIERVNAGMLWNGYLAGKGEVYCNFADNLVCFRLLTVGAPPGEEVVMVKNDENPFTVCKALLRTSNDFLDFSIKYGLGKIS